MPISKLHDCKRSQCRPRHPDENANSKCYLKKEQRTRVCAGLRTTWGEANTPATDRLLPARRTGLCCFVSRSVFSTSITWQRLKRTLQNGFSTIVNKFKARQMLNTIEWRFFIGGLEASSKTMFSFSNLTFQQWIKLISKWTFRRSD